MDSADPIRAYLLRLEAAMAGHDAALVHDAVLDADEHLRAAVRAGASPERAVSEYGTPEEVARAYVEAESGPRGWRETPAPARPAATDATAGTAPTPAAAASTAAPAPAARGLRGIPVIGIWFDIRAWGAMAYFGAVGFALSLAYFVWAISLGSLALGLLPLVLGIPLLVLLLGSARAICLFEGKVVEFFLRVRMPRRVQPVAGTGNGEIGFWARIGCWLRDIRSWMSLGYLLGNFPVALVAFVVIVVLASVGVALVLVPIGSLLHMPVIADFEGDMRISMLGQELTPDSEGRVFIPIVPALVVGLVGFAILTGTLWIARGLGVVYGYAVQAIQVARPQPIRASSRDTSEPPIITSR